MAELVPGAASVVDRLFDGSVLRQRRASGTQRRELVEIVLRGGYPIAVGLAPEPRSRWFANLAALVVERVGSGLAAHLQGITAERLSPVDPAAASCFGALLETFVVTEVLKQAGWASEHVSAYHYRTADGIEVKVGSQVGLLLISGSQAQPVGDRLSVAPVDILWRP
jgi:hypothetical protein